MSVILINISVNMSRVKNFALFWFSLFGHIIFFREISVYFFSEMQERIKSMLYNINWVLRTHSSFSNA